MKRFKKLLVYAGTDQPETAILRAVAIAAENGAKLTLLDVVKPMPRALGMMSSVAHHEEMDSMLVAARQQELLAMANEYASGKVSIDAVVRTGDPTTEIIRESMMHNHDLVIKTADGFGTSGRLFGSIARSLLRNCPTPMLLLKPAVHGEFDQIVAAVDVDASDDKHQQLNKTIVDLATTIAVEDQATLHLLAAWDFVMEGPLRRRAGDAEVDAALEAHETRVTDSLAQLMESHPEASDCTNIHVLRGSAATVIQSAVERFRADLLVMGTVCRTGVAGFLIGNTAESVLSELSCSVLALKPEGFVSPISLADDDTSERFLSTTGES